MCRRRFRPMDTAVSLSFLSPLSFPLFILLAFSPFPLPHLTFRRSLILSFSLCNSPSLPHLPSFSPSQSLESMYGKERQYVLCGKLAQEASKRVDVLSQVPTTLRPYSGTIITLTLPCHCPNSGLTLLLIMAILTLTILAAVTLLGECPRET